jgi:hypothetical protein
MTGKRGCEVKKARVSLRIARTWISLGLITALIFPTLSCGPKAVEISINILGGEVETTDHKAKVLIPHRALAEEKDITIESAVAPELSGGLSIVGDTYEFGPADITFGRPVTITLAYKERDLPQGVAPEDLLLVAISDDGNFTVLNNMRANTESGTVSGDISHFSLIGLTHVAVESSLEVNPEDVDFGDVLVSTTSTETVTITNPTANDIQITGLEIAPFAGKWGYTLAGLVPAFAVAPTSTTPITVPARGERQIQVNFHPISTDVYRCDLLVSTRDATTKIHLAGTGVLSLGGLSIMPDFHDFGPVKLLPPPASTATAGFLLVNNSTLQIQINSAQVTTFPSSTGIFSPVGASPAGSALNPGADTPVNASYTPETMNAEFGYILVLGTDSVGNPAGAVSLLQGHGVLTEPGIKIDPPLDFGKVLVGTSVTLNSAVYNTGTVDFNWTGYASDWPSFLPTGAFAPLGPLVAGASVPAPITFCPETRGYYSSFVEAAGTYKDRIGMIGDGILFAWGMLVCGSGVDAELTFAPDPCDFGQVSVGESSDMVITVTNTGDFDVTVAGYKVPNAPFEVITTVLKNITLAKGQSHTYTIRFSPTDEQQYQSAFSIIVQFDYRGQKIKRTFPVSLSGSGIDCAKHEGALTVDPIEFGEVLVGTQDTKTTWITNVSKATPDGVKVAVNDVMYIVDSVGQEFAPVALQNVGAVTTRVAAPVTFMPLTRGTVSGTIHVGGTACGKTVTASAGVSGTGVDTFLAFNPDPCDFGNVCVGDSKQIRVTVTNIGDFDVTVADYEWPEAPFEVISTVPRNLTLAETQSYEYNIEFSPLDVGLQSDSFGITVEFEHRGQKYTREFSLVVSGTGVPCLLSVAGWPSCDPTATGATLDFQVLAVDLTNGQNPIVLVVLYIDGEIAYSSGVISVAEFPPPPGIIFRRETTRGPHTIRVVAMNILGQEREETWSVFCGEEPPSQPPISQPPEGVEGEIAYKLIYEHTMPGVQSEVYLDITGPAGANIDITLSGPGVVSPAHMTGTLADDGKLRLTWVINQFGTYSVSGTVGGAPVSATVSVQ